MECAVTDYILFVREASCPNLHHRFNHGNVPLYDFRCNLYALLPILGDVAHGKTIYDPKSHKKLAETIQDMKLKYGNHIGGSWWLRRIVVLVIFE